IEDAGAEIARGKPGSAELAGEVGGEERACLRVLNLPALDECRQKRAEHDRRDARCEEVKADGEECAERLRWGGGGLECVWRGKLQNVPVSVCLATAGAGRLYGRLWSSLSRWVRVQCRARGGRVRLGTGYGCRAGLVR